MSDWSDTQKRCTRCCRRLPADAFASNRSTRDGKQTYCRACCADYYRQRQLAKGHLVRVRKAAPEGSKYCPGCTEVKPHSEWNRNRASRDGWASYCRPCLARRGRESYFRRKYGLSEAEIEQRLEDQAGRCPICLAEPAVHVDHDHETGVVRGLVCFQCNAALGQLRNSPFVIRRAAAYLEGTLASPMRVSPGVFAIVAKSPFPSRLSQTASAGEER